MTDLSHLTHERFQACREQRFAATDAGAEPVELVLTEVQASESFDQAQQARRGFSLIFEGPGEPALGQGTYTLSNPNLGELAVFLVPVGREGERMLYEAVFN